MFLSGERCSLTGTIAIALVVLSVSACTSPKPRPELNPPVTDSQNAERSKSGSRLSFGAKWAGVSIGSNPTPR